MVSGTRFASQAATKSGRQRVGKPMLFPHCKSIFPGTSFTITDGAFDRGTDKLIIVTVSVLSHWLGIVGFSWSGCIVGPCCICGSTCCGLVAHGPQQEPNPLTLHGLPIAVAGGLATMHRHSALFCYCSALPAISHHPSLLTANRLHRLNSFVPRPQHPSFHFQD